MVISAALASEGRGPFVPVFLSVLDKGLTDGELGLFFRILAAAFRRRGRIYLVKAWSLACALRDRMGGDLRSMKRDLPTLLKLGMVVERADERGQRVLEVPSWQAYRSRPTTTQGRADDAATTAREHADDGPTTAQNYEGNDSEDLATPSPALLKEKEREERERDPRARTRVSRASEEPDPSPPAPESGVQLREELLEALNAPPTPPMAAPAPSPARESTPAQPDVVKGQPGPFDQPVTFPLPPAAGLDLIGAFTAGAEEHTGKYLPAKMAHVDLVGIVNAFASELAGVRWVELRAIVRTAAGRFVAETKDRPRKVQGFPMFAFKDWLNEGNAKWMRRPKPTVAKASPAPSKVAGSDQRGATPDEIDRILREGTKHCPAVFHQFFPNERLAAEA